MQSFLKKIDIIYIVLLLFPIIDSLNTIIGFSLSLVARGIFLACMLFYFVFLNKSKYKKQSFFLLFLLFLFFVVYMLHYYNLNKTFYLTSEGITLIKFMYLPIITICLINYYTKKEFKITEILYKVAILYGLLIIIPTLFGVSLESYEYGKKGFSGLFYSPNELSTILAILTPFVFVDIIKNKRYSLPRIFGMLLFVISCFVLGTKTSVIGIWLTLILFIGLSIIRFLFKQDSFKKVIIYICIIILSIVGFNFSYLKYNMSYQTLNYIPTFANTDEEDDDVVITDKTNFKTAFINFPSKAFNTKISDNKILNMVFSSRNVYLQNNFSKWSNANNQNKVFGLSLGYNSRTNGIVNTTEIDMFDIFIYYGVVGVVFLLVYLIIISVWLIIVFLRHFKKNVKDEDLCTTYMSYFIGILIAFTAGHTISAPTVSIFIALSLVFFNKKFNYMDSLAFKKPFIWYSGFIILFIIASCLLMMSKTTNHDLNLTLYSDGNLTSDKELTQVEKRKVSYDNITDYLTYYICSSSKNVQIIHVVRHLPNDNMITFVTINNNESYGLDVIIDNVKKDKEHVLYSDLYYYVLGNEKYLSYSKYAIKDYIKQQEITTNKKNVILAANTSVDFYYINSSNMINSSKDVLPWLSFTGIYKPITDNIYEKSLDKIDFDEYTSNNLKQILFDNYKMYAYVYSYHKQDIWYKEYEVLESEELNGLSEDNELTDIVNDNMNIIKRSLN